MGEGLVWALACGLARAAPGPTPDEAPTAAPEALPADGLDLVTGAFFQRAEAELAESPTRAAQLYRLVLLSHPDYLPASLGLARALLAGGDAAAAIALYRGLGDEPDAVEALAALEENERPTEALRLWRRLKTLRLGDATPYLHESRILLPTDLDGALGAWETYATLLQGTEPDGLTLQSLVDALAAAGRYGDAESLVSAYLAAFPAGGAAQTLRASLDRMEIEQAAAALPMGGAEPLTAEQAVRARAVEAALRATDPSSVAGALATARELVAAAPRSDLAHALYGQALLRTGDVANAEAQLVLARALAPDNELHHLALARLLAEAYGGRRSAEALDELRQAVALAPGHREVRLELALAEQAAGEFESAILDFRALVPAVDGPPDGNPAAPVDDIGRKAAQRLEALTRLPARVDALPVDRPLALPPVAARHYRIALVYLGRGRTAEAGAELALALTAAPEAPLLLNLEARLLRQGGDLPGAIQAWERSLRADAAQGEVEVELGLVAEDAGDLADAEARYRSAAAHGAPDAHYLLARLASRRGDWSAVRAEIGAFDETSTGASLYDEGVAQLRDEAARRMWTTRVVGVSVVVGAIGVPLWIRARRRSAATLRQLLDGAPECWHDAARILAALRHEVLKHNTTVLPDVATALERGDRGPYEAFVERFPAVHERFEGYLDGLEALGLRHGYRLDLRGSDPTIAPMARVFRRLGRLRIGAPPDPWTLRGWSEVVNERAYAEIGRLVQEICVLPVTSELVRGVYARVAAEPGFAEATVPELVLSVEPGAHNVRMFRADLEDILANLLRNALGAGASTLTVEVREEEDPITAHAWTELRVVDDAPGMLTNAMIRGRYIGRGLGLAVDLVNRHGGTISVLPVSAPGGRALSGGDEERARKAVVVQLPAVEAASVEVEWTS